MTSLVFIDFRLVTLCSDADKVMGHRLTIPDSYWDVPNIFLDQIDLWSWKANLTGIVLFFIYLTQYAVLVL